jgi:hypothetical protein
MTFLRDEGHIQITYPKPDEYGVTRGLPHYKVEYDIVVTVEGRNLRYEAIWTPKDNDQRSKKRKRSDQHKFEVLQTAQVSIASASARYRYWLVVEYPIYMFDKYPISYLKTSPSTTSLVAL